MKVRVKCPVVMDVLPPKIAIYRRLKKFAQDADIKSDSQDEFFDALEAAKRSPYSSDTFTANGGFPLADVLNLFENRPISFSGHQGTDPRP